MVWQHLDGAFEPLPAGRFAVADEVLQAELKRADAQAAGQILDRLAGSDPDVCAGRMRVLIVIRQTPQLDAVNSQRYVL